MNDEVKQKSESRIQKERRENLLMWLAALYSGFWILAPEFCLSQFIIHHSAFIISHFLCASVADISIFLYTRGARYSYNGGPYIQQFNLALIFSKAFGLH
jgi:hypothetical protein